MEGGVACSIRKSWPCSQKPNFCGDTNSRFIDIFLLKSKPILVALLHRPSNKPKFTEHLDTQQTFVLMKISWRGLEYVFCLCLQRTSSRRLDQEEHIHYTHTSLEDVFIKTNIFVLAIRLQDVFKTSCQDIFKMSCQDVFKMFLRRLAKTFSRHVQDVFKSSSKNI